MSKRTQQTASAFDHDQRMFPSKLFRVGDDLGEAYAFLFEPGRQVWRERGAEIEKIHVADLQRQLRAKQPVRVEAWSRDDSTLLATGVVDSTDNAIDTSTGTLRIKASLPNPKGELLVLGQRLFTQLSELYTADVDRLHLLAGCAATEQLEGVLDRAEPWLMAWLMRQGSVGHIVLIHHNHRHHHRQLQKFHLHQPEKHMLPHFLHHLNHLRRNQHPI